MSRQAREMDEYTSEPSGEGADGRCSRYYIRASEPSGEGAVHCHVIMNIDGNVDDGIDGME